MDAELSDILEVPWEREGSLLDAIRKDGVNDETVEKAVVAAVRLLKGVEGEFSPEMIEKLGTELYGRGNPALNTTSVSGLGELFGAAGGDDTDGSASGPNKDGSGAGADLIGDGDEAPKVAADHPEGCDCADCADVAKSDGKPSIAARMRAALTGVSVSKEDSSDMGDVTNEQEGGTVEVQVPVKKEDGTWDFANVPEENREFFTEQIEKAAKMERELADARERLQKADDTLRHREMLAKAAGLSHVAPADDLAPILKEASVALDSETFGKLEALLTAAEERIAKGDLFQEQGSRALSDGSETSDAYAEAIKKATEKVEKSEKHISQEQALARVFEENPGLYSKYLAQTGLGRV